MSIISVNVLNSNKWQPHISFFRSAPLEYFFAFTITNTKNESLMIFRSFVAERPEAYLNHPQLFYEHQLTLRADTSKHNPLTQINTDQLSGSAGACALRPTTE